MSEAIDPALEVEYSLRPRHPEREAVYAAMEADGRPLRALHAATMDLPYGPGPRQRLDYFAAGAGTPLLVFFHGGYWRALSKELFAFLAAPLLEAGVSVAMPGYDLVPDVPLAAIPEEAASALAFLAASAGELGFDPARVVLSGHSAGAQLAAMCTLSAERPLGLRGLLGVSGVYDLAPLLATSVGHSIGLDEETASAMSPVARVDLHRGVEALFLVGADETAGFREQTARMAAAWSQAGGCGQDALVPRTNHFTVLRHLFAPDRVATVKAWLAPR